MQNECSDSPHSKSKGDENAYNKKIGNENRKDQRARQESGGQESRGKNAEDRFLPEKMRNESETHKGNRKVRRGLDRKSVV